MHARKPVRIFSNIVFQAMPAKNVWPLCPKPTHAQVSTALYVRTVTSVRAWICMYRWYAGFLPTSKGSAILSQSRHWFRQSPGLPDLLHCPCVIKVVEGVYRKPAHGIHCLPIYATLEKTTSDSYTYCEILCWSSYSLQHHDNETIACTCS